MRAKNMKIFSGNSNIKLAKSIAKHVNSDICSSSITEFTDGEISVNICETVRGSDVFVIQSTSFPVNQNLMELLIMVDAFKRASAYRITAVIPYFGYARQDRKTKSREPISAKLVSNLIAAAGADRVLTMDLHAAQIQGFFDIPVDHLLGAPILAKYYDAKIGEDKGNFIAVSPDIGSVARVRHFAEKLDIPLAIVDKRRQKANESEVMNIIGEVKGKRVLLVDDMIDTAGTIVNAAQALHDKGAIEVNACCTHGVLSGKAIEKIEGSVIDELIVLDTISLPEEKLVPNIKVLSVAEVFGEAIDRIYKEESISTLFN